MIRITNTSEIKYGDIILGLPTKFDHYGAFIKTDPALTEIRPNKEDECIDIHIHICDVESFSEECYLAKCIMIDNTIHFVDLKSGDTFCWDLGAHCYKPGYTIWKLDIKF